MDSIPADAISQIVNPVASWVSELFTQRWAELLCLAVMLCIWRWFMGHKYQAQIDDLKSEIERINKHGIRIEGDLHITKHYYGKDGNSRYISLEGKGDLVIPGSFTGGVISGLPLTGVKIIHTKAKDK